MRPKYEWRSASKENYNKFCEKSKTKISFKQFQTIIRTWNDLFMKHLLNTGDKVKLPYGVGPMVINKKKKNGRYYIDKDGNQVLNLAIDYKSSKELGKRVYHLNYHTEGYSFTWAWFPRDSYIKLAFIWKFKAARIHSRTLASVLKNPNSSQKDLYKTWIFKS